MAPSDDLVERWFDGSLDEAGVRELETLLKSDPDARRRMARGAREQVDLAGALGRPLPEFQAPEPRVSSFRFLGWAAAAAVFLGLVWLSRQAPAPAPEPVVAAVTEVKLRSGLMRLLAPTIYEVAGDVVTLKAGHVELDLTGPMSVETPAGRLLNEGTRYEVRLNRAMDIDQLQARAASGNFRPWVTARVLEGIVKFIPRGQEGAPRRLTPELGTVALSEDPAIGRVRDREGIAQVKPVGADRWSVADEHLLLEAGDWIRTGARGANALSVALGRAGLILGPGALVELVDPTTLRLVNGEVELSCPKDEKIEILGPGDARLSASGTRAYRVQQDKLSVLEKYPAWLDGYKGNASTEALGSLLASIDGRDVALEIGYYKVVVDIRDQIARTEIEESFLNTTSSILEGVFYFPLPQDASISGFGMWIGDEYVHADVVEKQRAREIYETILRERRDPGLLEWSGGNIFKARVFPIGAEKRIKISYTQVLPKVGDTYRYLYALQSEMLRLHPLKKLQIEVKISSSEPLTSVVCPSHPCRIRTAGGAASAEFDAQEYAPQTDFELRVTTRAEAGALTVVPHRRGDDGYFLVGFNVPAAGEDRRETLPGGKPLSLIVMADTSGSMHGAARKTQLDFIDALLSSLSKTDRFRVLTCDTEARWSGADWVPARDESVAGALRFVQARRPLGWSDLDKAFDAVFEKAVDGVQVVYVGDGTVTTGDADPVAFAQRLKTKYGGKGSFHAVAPGSAFEPGVMKAIAGLGGGSWREIGGGSDPAKAAYQLLKELAAPGLKDVSVAFEGMAVAAVYPGTIPNVAAGTQQFIVGRFNPTGGEVRGKVVVRGKLDGRPVAYAGQLVLAGADEGNSFIPRFWARQHLDHLLEQGSAPEIKERIIALSEDYQIITPYTSFLVLESDADRERFGVKKRFRMRDGEEFFALGRQDATFELTRKQMLLARSWRLRLQREALTTISGLGRDLMEALAPELRAEFQRGDSGRKLGLTGSFGDKGRYRDELRYAHDEKSPVEGGESDRNELEDLEESAKQLAAPEPASVPTSPALEAPQEEVFERKSYKEDRRMNFDGRSKDMLSRKPASRERLQLKSAYGWNGYLPAAPRDFLGGLFPDLSPVPPGSIDAKWSKEVLDLIRTLDHRVAAARGVRIVVSGPGGTSTETIVGPKAWAVLPSPVPGQGFRIDWSVGNERGAIDATWLTSSVRPRHEHDEHAWPRPLDWLFEESFRAYAGYTAELAEGANGTKELALRHPRAPKHSVVVVIDPRRGVVLEVRSVTDGKVQWATLYEDFVELAGAFWPRKRTVRGAGDEAGDPLVIAVAVSADPAADIAARLTLRAQALQLGPEPASIDAARQAVADGRASFEDCWMVLRHWAARQDWDKAEAALKGVEAAAAGRTALVPIRAAILLERRRLEELRKWVVESAGALKERPADYAAAQQLLGYAGSFHQGNERLEVVRLLKPVFERRAGIPGAALQYEHQVLGCLQAMGKPEAVFAQQQSMAERFPKDLGVLIAYAQALAQRSRVDDALAFLKAKEAGGWKDEEIGQIRRTLGDLLLAAYRLEPFLNHMDAWRTEKPATLNAYDFNKLLSAQILLDRVDAANALMAEWLAGDDVHRLLAAIQHGCGQGYLMYRNRMDPEVAVKMAATARRLLDRPDFVSHVATIAGDGRFVQTDAGRAFLAELHADLKARVQGMEAERFVRHFSWVRGHLSTDEGEAGWQALLDQVYLRWQAAQGEDKDHWQGLLAAHGRTELKLKLFRALGTAGQASLFELLLEQPWTAETEKELVELLPKLKTVPLFHHFMDWLPAARAKAAVAALPDVNAMPRRKLAEANGAALREARAAALELLAALEVRDDLKELRKWILAERLYLQARLKRDLAKVGAAALAQLQAIRGKTLEDRVLAGRMAWTASFAAVQEAIDPALVLAALAAGEAASPELLDWKHLVYTLLTALDRGADVQARLKDWYGAGDKVAVLRWGRDYARILAERNRIDEAVAVLEAVEKHDGLGHEEYRLLAGWYLVQGKKEARREAQIKSWAAMNEHELGQALYAEYAKVSRSRDQVPAELDEETTLKLVALFRKAQSPANYLWTLQNLYSVTRDFRLLECLPEGVMGQSASRIYPFLGQLRQLTSMLQEEATLDRLSAQLRPLHDRAKSDVDKRGLRLLEFVVQHRAATQAHGAGPHVAKALTALKEAWRGVRVADEPELLAGFLAAQGGLVPALAEEQLRQLRELFNAAPARTWGRLSIGAHYAEGLWANGRKAPAAELLGSALEEFRQAGDGLLPASANGYLQALGSYREGLGEFRAAEQLWLSELARPHPEGQIQHLTQMLYQHYQRALSARAEVSLGRGEALYRALYAKLLAELKRPTNEGQMHQFVQTLVNVWHAAFHDLKFGSVKEDVRTFAFDELPGILALYQYRSGQHAVGQVAQRVVETLGARTALEFLATRAEREPAWLRLQDGDFWPQLGGYAAQYRTQAGVLGAALEERLLALVLRELRDDLRTRTARNRNFYSDDHSYFWQEKRGDFLRVALELLEASRTSEAGVVYIARYLYDGLTKHPEGIDALFVAQRAGILGIDSRHLLCQFLQRSARWAESIPLLVRLIEARPGTLDYRVMLMRAYNGTGDRAALLATHAAAARHFKDAKQWNEGVLASLGAVCVETRLFAEGAAHLEEAIALHVKASPTRGLGDGTTSHYYTLLSSAHSGLGHTDKAVDAAAGAIVSWGRSQHQRQTALQQLEQVLAQAADLDAYVVRLDQQVRESGLENPIVRKALGKVYLGKNAFGPAALQFRRAAEGQPNDVETHQLLVGALDKAGRPEEALAQLLESAAISGHDLTIYQQLGKRFEGLGDAGEAARAYTTMVEMLPHESEGHEAYAKVLDGKARWSESLVSWRNVIRVRTKEPGGWLGLANAQIQAKDFAGARVSVEVLRKTDWPVRFSDVRSQADALAGRIPR